MIEKVFVPPIKIQGIKTKIVNLISDNVYITPDTIWYEPFMGFPKLNGVLSAYSTSA